MTMPASSKKLIIFDWDGTLSDSVSRIARCIQLSASDHLLPVPSFDQAKDIIGLGFIRRTNKLHETFPIF